jgi:hypothetical protein
MNELKALEELGMALDPAATTPPDQLRQRVLTEAARPAPTRFALPRFALPRPAWRLAVAGGMAAVLTAGILLTQVVQFGDQAPASSASAAQILQGAATQAQRQPTVAVRGDQFVYVESITSGLSQHQDGSNETESFAKNRQIWLSVDGTQDGVLRERPRSGGGDGQEIPLPGCRDGVISQSKGGKTYQSPCEPVGNYQGDLPTNTDEMLAYLYQRSGGTKNPREQEAFKAAGDLIHEAYLAPASLAAVFGAIAKIPGVTVVGDVTDEAGRTGVAVSLTEVQGQRSELIFDRRSFAFLGERSVQVRDQDGLKAGQVAFSVAVLKVAIVDQAGQSS